VTGASRTPIDVTKITGPYPLLGLFLVVVEGMLLFWMARAEEGVERTIAGGLMALLLAAFLFAFLRMRKEIEPSAVEAPGLAAPVTPAKTDANISEVTAPHPDEMAGRDYVIARPPDDWVITKMTEREAIASNLGIADEAAIQAMLGDDQPEADVLSLRAPRFTEVIFMPGLTLIDGRKVPTALAIDVPVGLRVIPMNRAQPPYYVERNMEHNLQQNLAQIMRIPTVGLAELPKLSETGSRRRQISVVLKQRVENAVVDGQPGATIEIYIAMIAIEGDVRDHLLFMNYPAVPASIDSQLTEDVAVLQGLVDSFRSLKVIDPAGEQEALRELANRKLEEFKRQNGEKLFWTELVILGARLAGMDMDNASARLTAIRQLEPFELLAQDLGLTDDDDLNDLWKSMHEAEAGDATEFKDLINELIQGVLATDGDDADVTADDDSQPAATTKPSHRQAKPSTSKRKPKSS